MTLAKKPFRVAGGGVLAAAIAVLGACGEGNARYPTAESKDVAPTSGTAPCSQRLEPIPLEELPQTGDIEAALRDTLGAEKMTGVRENAQILPAEPDTGPVLRVRYPEGSIAFSSAKKGRPLGGASFYVPIPDDTGDKAICLHYKVRFPEGFEYAKGGKLPGLYSDEAPSGGDKVTGDDGWSVRLMWRQDGDGELYEYIVNKKSKFGLSVGRGAFELPRGKWTSVELEVIPNDPGQANGIARLWIDGQATIEQDDIVFRNDDKPVPRGLMFSTFFGGSSNSWASPKDQHIDFAGFRLFSGG